MVAAWGPRNPSHNTKSLSRRHKRKRVTGGKLVERSSSNTMVQEVPSFYLLAGSRQAVADRQKE
jgi:hypothetical protein